MKQFKLEIMGALVVFSVWGAGLYDINKRLDALFALGDEVIQEQIEQTEYELKMLKLFTEAAK